LPARIIAERLALGKAGCPRAAALVRVCPCTPRKIRPIPP